MTDIREIPVRQQRFEATAFSSVPRDSQAQPQHSKLHPIGPEVVAETLPDGATRYYRVCTRHQMASRGVDDLENALPCSLCRAELEEGPARLRYAEIHHRLVLGL